MYREDNRLANMHAVYNLSAAREPTCIHLRLLGNSITPVESLEEDVTRPLCGLQRNQPDW